MTTRQPLTEAEKMSLAERRAAGATYPSIAHDLGCAVETVRKHARRQRDHQVSRARGRPARGILSTYPAELVERAVAVKRDSSTLGTSQCEVRTPTADGPAGRGLAQSGPLKCFVQSPLS